MKLSAVLQDIIEPALVLLPANMDSPRARVFLLAVGLQESRFEYRAQMGGGPARGFWQFEQGTQASRGGVWGVYLHPASREYLRGLCDTHGVEFEPRAIWAALENNDIFACCVARLLMWTNPKPLPAVGDVQAAWNLYASSLWRPGKPHPETWSGFYDQAVKAVA